MLNVLNVFLFCTSLCCLCVTGNKTKFSSVQYSFISAEITAKDDVWVDTNCIIYLLRCCNINVKAIKKQKNFFL